MTTKQKEIDSLLKRIRRRGWTDRLASEFQAKYERRLQWMVIVHMEKAGLLQWRIGPDQVDALSNRRLELYENSVSDVWIRLFRGLTNTYLERVESGKVHQAFLPYMNGVIRHLVIENARSLGLLGRETPTEILRSICEAKLEKTRETRTSWAKYCLEHKVRTDLLLIYPRDLFERAYGSIHRIVDFFFEQFMPNKCDTIKTRRHGLLGSLVEEFAGSQDDFERALDYIGTITPFANRGVDIDESAGSSDDEYFAALQQLVLHWS